MDPEKIVACLYKGHQMALYGTFNIHKFGRLGTVKTLIVKNLQQIKL